MNTTTRPEIATAMLKLQGGRPWNYTSLVVEFVCGFMDMTTNCS